MEESFVLNPLDIIIFSVVGIGMYIGSKRGIFQVSTSIISIFLAIIFGFRFRKIAETIFLDYLDLNLTGQTAAILGFCTAFVVIYILLNAIFAYLKRGLEMVNLGLDKALGALFGGAVATFGLSMLLFALSFVNFPSPDNERGSIAYPYVKSFAYHSLRLVPRVLNEANKQIQRYNPAPYTAPAPPSNDPGTPAPPTANSNQKPKAIR